MNPKGFPADRLAAALLAEKPVLRDKIQAGVPCSPEQVPAYLTEVLRFMALIAWSKQRLTPPRKLDLVWHEFILCTRLYHGFCHQHFGRFIHHDPGGTDAENARQYRKTLQLFSMFFGAADPELWGCGALHAQVACGACEGDAVVPESSAADPNDL
ncbi:glycine-rich domain-containing protein [Acanthopleuribacter pedis]|uniref:Uncharacterized protein n=1 Tax=Acanthopleuribacter pedis TaxID=442870 RepID=A0A8J7U0T5_9BACT|nr:hypothetical protein [Acanthopleuribacter pedis]MBO1317418.1 hypothetical protein [Acanthopleuribacter pedis]